MCLINNKVLKADQFRWIFKPSYLLKNLLVISIYLIAFLDI